MGELYTDGFEIVYGQTALDVEALIRSRYIGFVEGSTYRPIECGELVSMDDGPVFREHLIEAIEDRLNVPAAFIADAEYGDYYRLVEDGLKLMEST